MNIIVYITAALGFSAFGGYQIENHHYMAASICLTSSLSILLQYVCVRIEVAIIKK